jgi:hypothetical protein
VRRADSLTTFIRLSRNLGTWTSWHPKGLSRHVMGLLYLLLESAKTVVWWALLDVIAVLCAQTTHEIEVSTVSVFEDRNVCLCHNSMPWRHNSMYRPNLIASISEARIFKISRESELQALSRSYKLLASNSLRVSHVPTCPLNYSSWWSLSCPSDFISTRRDEETNKQTKIEQKK